MNTFRYNLVIVNRLQNIMINLTKGTSLDLALMTSIKQIWNLKTSKLLYLLVQKELIEQFSTLVSIFTNLYSLQWIVKLSFKRR